MFPIKYIENNLVFNTPEVEYDNSIGRIVKMSFREINT